jgi:hypothetical protein
MQAVEVSFILVGFQSGAFLDLVHFRVNYVTP